MAEKMTSVERVTAALEHREPDRIPTFDVMEELHSIYEILGRRPLPLGFLFSNKYTSRALDLVAPLAKETGIAFKLLDGICYDRTAAAAQLGYDAAWVMHVPIWKFNDTKTAVDIYGRTYDVGFDRYGNLDTPMYRGGLIKSLDDWNAWDKRDLLKWPERTNRVFKRIQRDFGDRLFVMPSYLFGLFENSWQPLGFERFTVALRKERDFLKRMIKFYEDHYCMMIEAWADAGVPGFVYTDDQAFRSGPMINPKYMKELYTDSFCRITDTAHRLGMKIIVHSCGKVYDLLEWWADCGFDGVHALEPTAEVEIAKVKEMVGDRMCLVGNIDITHILVDAAKEEVFEDVRRHIRDAGKGGGYMIAPTNSHPDMSIERIRWMLEATEKYGRYPLDPELLAGGAGEASPAA
jgi:uroporphyrinogen decarboxylase